MSMQLKIKIRSYEASLVDQTARNIAEEASKKGVKVSGPVPLPTKREIFTILRSTHIYKKSREQFEIRTHKRLIILKNVDEKLMELLKRMEISSGVDVEIVTS